MSSRKKSNKVSNESNSHKTSSTDGDNNNSNQLISWNEIHKHNSREDCWIVVKGKVYDITEWVPHHPGGDLLLQGAGREATPFFQAYHPTPVFSMINKYQIGIVENYKPYYSWDSEFYSVLKKRVEAHMRNNKLNDDSATMYFKTILIIIGWIISYYYSMVEGYVIGAILYGFFNSHLGISVAHDGNHGSYSKNKYINFAAAFATDMMGGSWIIWTLQHNIGHHPHSNRQGDYEDEDFDPDSRSGNPLVMLSPYYYTKEQENKTNNNNNNNRTMYRYQHLYIWLLFPFVGIKWMYGDIKYFMQGRYQTMEFWKFSNIYFMIQILTKLIFFSHSFILPIYLHGLIKGFLLCSILFTVNSYMFALLFAVNHLTDVTLYPKDDEKEKDWAKLQVLTSSNFSPNSTFALWFSGGLNYQIEHHLFPYICHVHLPSISPIVKQTCKEFNVKYNCFDNYFIAIKSYYNHLKRMGELYCDDNKN